MDEIDFAPFFRQLGARLRAHRLRAKLSQEDMISRGFSAHAVYAAACVTAPPMPWYSLGHTFGTELAASGVQLPVVRDLMGHSDIKTTMRYVTVVDAQKRDAIALAFDRKK